MKHYLLKYNIISLPSLVSPFDKCLNVYTPVLHCLTTGTQTKNSSTVMQPSPADVLAWSTFDG